MHLEEVEAIETIAPVFAPLEELLPNFRTGPLQDFAHYCLVSNLSLVLIPAAPSC